MISDFTKKLLHKKFYIDSRLVKENAVFICIKGPKNDGHKFIKSILNKYKKTIIICEKKSKYSKIYKDNKRVFFCNSSIQFIKDLAKINRLILDKSFFIGITGSSGKTTLKEMLYSVLSKFEFTYKSPKSFNNEIGLPYTLINQSKRSKFNIYEIGMNNFGEIDHLTKILRPNLGIITNIGEAHLGNLGSLKNIAKAKSEIINNITNGGTVILNHDCKFFQKLKKISKKKKLRVFSFGINFNSTISYKILNKNLINIKFKKKYFKLKLRDLSLNNINNVLTCILTLDLLNLKLSRAKNTLINSKNINGRGNKINLKKNIEIIDDSYNSNPVSLKNSIIEFWKINTKKKKILVIGDMLELGKFSSKKHADVAKYLKRMKFDRIYLIGKEVVKIFKQIKSTFWCKYYKNVNSFSKDFNNVLLENTIIMFKASNGVGLYKLLNKKFY